jgi:hypothetical protein
MNQDANSNDQIRGAVIQACRALMHPISRFLIRNGVGFKEFSEIAKEALVDVASQDYGIRGRKTNVSRAAVLTGLTRKEVTKIRRRSGGKKNEPQSAIGRPAKVLEVWHHGEGFQSKDARPLDLPYESGSPSFVDLVRKAGGDIPPRAMLKELVRSGSVIRLPDDKYRAVSSTFIPDPADPESIRAAGQAISDLVSTLNNNLFGDNSSGSLLERRVFTEGASSQDARKFRRLATVEAERLIALLNDWLTTQEKIRPQVTGEHHTVRLGLGVYIFEEEE